MLVFMVAAFGAVEEWSQLILSFARRRCRFCWCCVGDSTVSFNLPRLGLMYHLRCSWCLLRCNLCHYRPVWPAQLSPATVSIRKEMLGVDYESIRSIGLSVYPYATAETLRLVLVGTVSVCYGSQRDSQPTTDYFTSDCNLCGWLCRRVFGHRSDCDGSPAGLLDGSCIKQRSCHFGVICQLQSLLPVYEPVAWGGHQPSTCTA